MKKKKILLITILCFIVLLSSVLISQWHSRNSQWIHIEHELKTNNHIINSISRIDESSFFYSGTGCRIIIYVDRNTDFNSIEKAFLDFKSFLSDSKFIEELISHNRNFNLIGDMPFITVDFRYNDESDGLLYSFKTDMWCKYQKWKIEYAAESKYENKTY